MSNAISKILKFELLTLCFLTAISCYAFYYEGSMPDNFMSISSQDIGDPSIISFYLSSLVVGIGYFLGPWLFVPFVVHSLFYSFVYSKRDKFYDALSIVLLFIGTLSLFVLAFPEIVGKGLVYFSNSLFSPWQLGLVCFASLAAYLAFSFQGGGKQVLVTFFVFLGRLPEITLVLMRILNPVKWYNSLKEKKQKVVSKISSDIPKFLKDTPKMEEKKKPDDQSVFAKSMRKEAPKESTQLEFKEFNKDQDKKETPKKAARASKKSEDSQNYFELITPLSSSGTHTNSVATPENSYFEDIIRRIEDKLAEFKIDGKIVNILKGPVVDTFELDLGAGVKVSKVTTAEKDLSMALLGAPIRIVYPMIGRATVGIEVPRNPREVIYLSDVLETKEFTSSSKRLPVAMGKDAFGETFVVDLASMPHMLVAGATGAGKSVFINTLLVSLLVKKSPEQMKLILIDPKQLELALYSTLPHLVMPVITDAKTASISLLWACQEMDRRYGILKEFGVRNIEGFNEKLKNAGPDLIAKIHHHYENEEDPENYELPYLVIIVDEFADLILTKAGKEIENNICRLAAKARAAGIHLVLATQRPSVDVITGLIKSNFPTRVSFRVTSSVDSRTILNSTGAEKLLGKGDMLYRHGTENRRVHSSFVNEDEIEVLTESLAKVGQVFHEGALDFVENGGEQEKDPYAYGSHISSNDSSSGSSTDDLYSEAVRVVIEHRTASASMLQRRLRVGYNRAANLIEEMEEKGVVGPAEGSKRRKVLVSSAP